MKTVILLTLAFISVAIACPLCQDDTIEIVVVLDRSGSMEDIKTDMIGGFKQFIADQQKVVGSANFTLAQFDTEYELVHQGINIQYVTGINLVPRGRTGLLDAVGKTIKETSERLAKTPERKVVFVIITDGLENASTEYEKSEILEMINHMEEIHDWKFVYLGAKHEAFTEAASIGISLGQIMYFDNTNVGLTIDCVSTSLTSYRTSGEFRLNPNDPNEVKE